MAQESQKYEIVTNSDIEVITKRNMKYGWQYALFATLHRTGLIFKTREIWEDYFWFHQLRVLRFQQKQRVFIQGRIFYHQKHS